VEQPVRVRGSQDSRIVERVRLDLKDQHSRLLEEARIILPGQQALFGFQLVAIFNEAFFHRLQAWEQQLHLTAIGLTLLAVGLSVTPAAMHRQSEPASISEQLVKITGTLLKLALVPLIGAMSVDFYIVSRMILGHGSEPLIIGVSAGATLAFLWFVLPAIRAQQRKKEDDEAGDHRPA
jgi:hypothetical protein